MRRFVLLLLSSLVVLVLAACGARTASTDEALGTSDQPFTSNEASLYDFAFDGKLTASVVDASNPKPLVVAQLMFAMGQLNGDRAVGRYQRLELSEMAVTRKSADTVEIRYHATLPVAWGGPAAPGAYTFVLPARIGADDQVTFFAKYGVTCVDASVGPPNLETMSFVYRPQRSGCELGGADVVRFGATVAPSTEQTKGKYPEYDRIWEDGVLSIVVLMTRDIETGPQDEGIQTFVDIEQRIQAYLATQQPDGTRRMDPALTGTPDTKTPVKLGAVLADGRRVVVDMMLVPHLLDAAGPELDAWFDAVTPAADIVLYNGHAGLGANIRALSRKGSFRPRQYVIWAVNGCDTFAYLDRTLETRRAVLNPDDPNGTRYMDQVANAMPGYFTTAPAFTMSFVEGTVPSGAVGGTPKSFSELLETVSPIQVAVVTGEEDNLFDPKKDRAWAPVPAADGGAPADAGAPAAVDGVPAPASPPPAAAGADASAATPAPPPSGSSSGCAASGAPGGDGPSMFAFALAGLFALRARGRSGASSSRARP